MSTWSILITLDFFVIQLPTTTKLPILWLSYQYDHIYIYTYVCIYIYILGISFPFHFFWVTKTPVITNHNWDSQWLYRWYHQVMRLIPYYLSMTKAKTITTTTDTWFYDCISDHHQFQLSPIPDIKKKTIITLDPLVDKHNYGKPLF